MSIERIAVTGVGAVSALAASARGTFERLLAGRPAVYDHSYRELEYFKSKLDRMEGSSP